MAMDLSNYSISELVKIYSSTIRELKNRGVLRTKNVVGELGEYLVLEYYDKRSELPNLTIVPVGTKNINAISQSGERYSIKTTTGNVTGVIYGLEPPGSNKKEAPLFEQLIICKLNEDCEIEGIYQLSWDVFCKHKKWHSRVNAWNISLSKAVKADAITIFEKEGSDLPTKGNGRQKETNSDAIDFDSEASDIIPVPAVTWNKTEKINHNIVKDAAVERIQKITQCNFNKSSQSRYVSSDRDTALFVLSASYSQKNAEYWYSINDEIIDWLKLFPRCYVAFALGAPDRILLLSFEDIKKMIPGCLRTEEDPSKNKKAHYHFSFAVEGSQVFFKKKLPEREFVNVSAYLK